MADFPFDQAVDDSISDAAPYLPTSTYSSLPCDHGSLPCVFPTQLDLRYSNAYSSTPDDDRNWPAPEEQSDEPYFPYGSDMPAPQYPDGHVPSYLGPMESFEPCNRHANLGKITEYKEWESTPVETKIEPKELPMTSTTLSSSLFDLNCPRSNVGYRRHSDPPLVDSDSTKSCGRPQLLSPSQTASLKRRQSSSGRPMYVLSTDAELELRLEKAGLDRQNPDMTSLDRDDHIPEPAKPKASTKMPHSLIERKYRENLNSTIVLLNQTLASTRRSQIETDAEDKITPSKPRKADVLNEAMRYVRQAEHESEARIKEIGFLRLRVTALEKLVGCRDCSLHRDY